jgi:hypothetical protein
MIKNRIKEHVTVRAGDLVPHPMNYRQHPDDQRQALAASYDEIGFARSLLGYRLPDGRIQLIDGHLRKEFDPDMEVTVEVLDVTEEEARKLLLTVDPLAALAQTNEEVHAQLAAITRSSSNALTHLWQSTREAARETRRRLSDASQKRQEDLPPEKFSVLIECDDEQDQINWLRKLKSQGVNCKAIIV